MTDPVESGTAALSALSLPIRMTLARTADKRRTPRYPGVMPVLLVTIAGRVDAKLVDASLTGVRLECGSGLLVPRQCRLIVPTMALDILIQRRWQKGRLSGWRFVFTGDQTVRVETAIDQLAARLRAGVED
jgi:hypothetical protein